MDKFLTALQDYGCKDLNVTMERFMQDEEFYYEILQQAIEDAGFETLGEQLKGSDAKVAFDTVHSLKGIIANCGITPLYDLIVAITEPLRAGSMEGLLPVYEELMEKRKAFSALIATLSPND